MTLITMNGNKIVTKNGGIATETDCCACPCPTNTCTDSCSCAVLTSPQPSIKVWDLGCEAWCTGGLYEVCVYNDETDEYDCTTTTLPGGSLTEPIEYYASSNPTLIEGCCYTLWNLQSQLRADVEGDNGEYPGSDFADEQFCYNSLDQNETTREGPLGPITVTLKCCPGVAKYTITYLYRNHLSNYTYGKTADTLNLCVVDGILKGSVIVNLGPSDSGSSSPNCRLCLIFGET